MERERISILVEVDTDPIPGWGHDPDDYVKHVARLLKDTIPHYNPTVRRLGEHEVIGPRHSLVLDDDIPIP